MDEVVQLTPEQQAQYSAASQNDVVNLTPDQQTQYRQQAGIVDPFHDFSPQQLVDLTVADPEHFDLVGKFAERPELRNDPAATQKVADAYNLLKQRGILEDLPNGKQILKTVWDTAKGFGKQAWNYAQAIAAPVGAGIAEAAGQPPEVPEQMLSEATRKIAENVAGTESAATGLGSMVKRGVGRLARGISLSKPLNEYTPEEKLNDLFGAVGEIQQQGEIAKGHGEALGAVGGHVVKELEQQGLPVRPEEVQQLASGDPFSWYAMGKAFQAGKALPGFGKGVGRVERTLEKTGELAAKTGGAVVTGAAKTAEVAAKGVEKAAVPVSAVAGAAAGAASHGPTGLLVGGAAGLKVGETIAGGAEKFGEAAKKAGEIGRQIAGAQPVSSAYAQAGRDILQALPGAATEVAKGGAFDLGLAATTAETPQEKAGVGIGTAFGLLGAGARLGSRFVSGQIIAPREYGTTRVVPSSGQFPGFDALHSAAMQAAAPGVRERVNAVRSFIQGAAPGTDVFLAKDAPALEQALLNAGVAPDQAKAFSNTEGFFTTDLPGKDGQPRRVILARNIEAAPHESFHAVQDILGESANRQLDSFIRGQFDDTQWNQLGESYARRLAGTSEGTWQENVLDGSGWGNAEAAEKIHQDIFNQLSQATDSVPNEATVTDLANRQWAQHLADAVKANPDQSPAIAQRMLWRNILSATEAQDVANRYLAREVAAENFDALFKNTGPTLEGGKAIPTRLARVVANLVSLVGGEPLAGRSSDIGGFPLKANIVEAVKSAAQAGKPTVEPAGAPKLTAPAPRIPAGAAITPEAAAEEARTAAAAAPETPLVAGGTKSAREILGQIAEAIAQRTGLKLNYLSAPDEPAAALSADRVTRRAMIEAYRNMPAAARALWEKTFFPERVLTIKGGKFQVLGWSPEVFAANAHRLAEFANKSSLVLPYELDPKTGSFSEAGWKQLFDDTQKFVSNQVGGRTGAGEELVVPKTATGAFKPPESGVAEALSQEKADVINALFGYKLPETPRISGGKLPLNVVGQEVSAATKPGRVEAPVRPRGEFTGEKAQKLGIEGRPILEVNPFRNKIAEAARTAGVEEPSFIEAQQRLNLENIKELEGAPEQPQFRGNTLTLTAGFQPEKTTTAFLDQLRNSTPEEWAKDSQAFRGKFSGGQTGWSFEVGSQSKTAEDAAAFRSAAEQFKQMSKDAMANKDYPLAMSLGSKAQAAREAFEAATGTHLDGSPGGADFIIKHKDPNYKPPVPPGNPELIGGQFQPSKNPRAIKAAAVRDEKGDTFTGTWHAAAFDQARAAGKDLHASDWERGFVTNSEEFLTRDQAADRAREMKQLTSDTPKDVVDLHSTDVQNLIGGQLQPRPYTEEERSKIAGANFSTPVRAYREASKAPTDNPWIRTSADPEADHADPSNGERVLMIQITSDLMNREGSSSTHQIAKDYYDKVYSGARPGFTRMDDFWEIPQWMGFTGHIFPKADAYVVRNVEQATKFLNSAGYDRVLFSAMDVNTEFIRDLAKSYKGKVDIGGWVDPKTFSDIPNAAWHNSLEDLAKAAGVPYSEGVDYRHFHDSASIPRLNLSQGCKYKCAFCSVEKKVTTVPDSVILQQAQEIGKLGTELVYLGDKTFGQAPNHKQLPELKTAIEKVNPNFKGFVVQTTASQLPKFELEWLKKSGIKFVELGIETYNDPILKAMHKPATEALMDKSADTLRKAGITLIPNILIGLPGETAETYARTLEFMQRNADVISHANIYNLAIYKDAELGKKINTASDGDFNENVLEKSFHDDPQVHRQFAGDLYGAASKMLDRPIDVQAQPKQLKDATDLWEEKPGITAEIGGLPVAQEKRGVTDQVGLPVAQEKHGEVGIEAQPRKSEDWKFKPASGSFSKAWITPAGVPIQLGGQWHHEYMTEHPELTKQFGLPTNFTAEDRFDALKKGFARINYSANNGALTVEAAAASWRKLKPAIEKLFEANIDGIDNMRVELFNGKGNVVDSDSAQLFKFDDAEKLQNIPFITGSQPKFQAQPASAAFRSENFDKELEDIRSGKSGGQTFTSEGDVWTPKAPTDIVTLASVNVPKADLNRDTVEAALRPYQKLLAEPGIVAGVFAFSKDEKPTVSIDINAAVPQKFRDNTLQFAKANDQVAIWDALKGETVDTGGKGDTRLTTPDEILRAYEPLQKGEPVDVDEVKKAAKIKTYPRDEIKNMTKSEVAAHFPESVIPRAREEEIPSRIVESPLYKSADSPEDAEQRFADKLVEFAKEWKDHPSYQKGLKWYSDFSAKMHSQFGADAPVMAELLAATSPNTTPEVNFKYAFDAFKGLQAGRFKAQISKFEEGLNKIADDTWVPWYNQELKAGMINNPPSKPTPAAFLARWIEKYNLLPKQSNGKLYGMHSVPVLRVFARQWLTKTSGLKTQNFVKNLIGSSQEATIDVWADRTMRRLGYSDSVDRWRILPKNKAAVSDKDFKFSQAVFKKAATTLGVTPAELQGGLWFAEKQLWSDSGWGWLDLGSYETEMKKVPEMEKTFSKQPVVEPRRMK